MSAAAPRALITGATAGLGAEFARQLAADGYDLVLVARNAERLAERAAELRATGVNVEVLAADLTDPQQLEGVAARLAQAEHPVGVLVNNAGFGLPAEFEQNEYAREAQHLQLLVAAPMRLTHAALPGMIARGGGQIINVASVAGFIPRGSYGACKAWVIQFSRWANLAYRSRGVRVTAVCPGFVHTEFHERMAVDTGTIPAWMWLEPAQVVREGLRDARRGRSVSVPSLRYKALVGLSRVLPDSVTAQAGARGR